MGAAGSFCTVLLLKPLLWIIRFVWWHTRRLRARHAGVVPLGWTRWPWQLTEKRDAWRTNAWLRFLEKIQTWESVMTKRRNIPSYVAVVVDPPFLREDGGGFKRVAELVVALGAAGVRYVTVFDADGICVADVEKCCPGNHTGLSQAVADVVQNLPRRFPALHVDCHCTHLCASSTANGRSTEERIVHIHVAGPDNGRGDILRAAQGFAVLGKAPTAAEFSVALRPTTGSGTRTCDVCPSEPQLLIKLGGAPSYDGFSPWHLRLTEMMFVENPSALDLDGVARSLEKFSQIEQRFGK